MFGGENLASSVDGRKTYYNATHGIRTSDLPHGMTSSNKNKQWCFISHTSKLFNCRNVTIKYI